MTTIIKLYNKLDEKRKKIEKLREITYPKIQITAPTRDKINAKKAKGNPSKKPNGLHSQPSSSAIFSLFLYSSMDLCEREQERGEVEKLGGGLYISD